MLGFIFILKEAYRVFFFIHMCISHLNPHTTIGTYPFIHRISHTKLMYFLYCPQIYDVYNELYHPLNYTYLAFQ